MNNGQPYAGSWASISFEQMNRPLKKDSNPGRAQKWRLVNRKLTEEMRQRSEFEVRFMSGRGGKISTLADFVSVYDLPLSQVTFIDNNGEMVYGRDLEGGRMYQIVISIDQFITPGNWTGECNICGDPFITVKRARHHCAECRSLQFCTLCHVVLTSKWEECLRSRLMLRRAKAGQKVCLECIRDLPDALNPADDDSHPLHWRMKIARARKILEHENMECVD